MDVYGLMPSYTEAVTKAGGIPLLIPLGLDREALTQIVDHVDGLLLPGGGDIDPAHYNGTVEVPLGGVDRERDQTELFLCKLVVDHALPFLAICRGLQVLNVALDGTLIEDIASMKQGDLDHDLPNNKPRTYLAHSVTVRSNSELSKHLGNEHCWVNSVHHQAIRDLAPGLEATAWAEDGTIEAAELPGHPFGLGVQWHPENLVNDDPAMLSLFEGLVTAAQDHKVNRGSRIVETPTVTPNP